MIFFSFNIFSFKKFYSGIYKYYKIIINLILKNDNNKNNDNKNDNNKNDNNKKIIPIIQKKYCYLCFNQIKNNTYCAFDKIFCTEYCRDNYINSLKIN